MTVKYTDMVPDRLYLFSGHLFCVKDGRYYRLPLDHFSGKFGPTWQSMNKYEMDHIEYTLVTVLHHPDGVKVVRNRSGRPVKFHIEIVGR